MSASAPALCPAQTYWGPAACLISSFRKVDMVLPIIRRRTSPIPIGRVLVQWDKPAGGVTFK